MSNWKKQQNELITLILCNRIYEWFVREFKIIKYPRCVVCTHYPYTRNVCRQKMYRHTDLALFFHFALSFWCRYVFPCVFYISSSGNSSTFRTIFLFISLKRKFSSLGILCVHIKYKIRILRAKKKSTIGLNVSTESNLTQRFTILFKCERTPTKIVKTQSHTSVRQHQNEIFSGCWIVARISSCNDTKQKVNDKYKSESKSNRTCTWRCANILKQNYDKFLNSLVFFVS